MVAGVVTLMSGVDVPGLELQWDVRSAPRREEREINPIVIKSM